MKVFYRPHRGGLKEAMDEAQIFDNIGQMLNYILDSYNDYGFRKITIRDISFERYSSEPDYRIGWDVSYIIKIKNIPYGFFTDEYQENWEEIYNDFLSNIK